MKITRGGQIFALPVTGIVSVLMNRVHGTRNVASGVFDASGRPDRDCTRRPLQGLEFVIASRNELDAQRNCFITP